MNWRRVLKVFSWRIAPRSLRSCIDMRFRDVVRDDRFLVFADVDRVFTGRDPHGALRDDHRVVMRQGAYLKGKNGS